MLRVYFDDELIDVEAYTELDNEYKLFTDTFKLGSVASNTFKLSVLKTAVNSQPANVRVEDDDTIMNFVVDNITEDDYVYSYTLTDKLLNFNFNYDASELINSKAELGEDCYLSDIWKDMCLKANVDYDDNYIFENDIVVNWYDSRVQARRYLSYIAELQSGYACILENGKQSFKKQNRSSVKTIDADECSDLIVGEKKKITRVVYDGGAFKWEFGDETGDTLYLQSDNVFIVNEQIVENIYNNIKDFEFYILDVPQAPMDSTIKAGDVITFVDNGKYYPTIAQYTMSYAGDWVGSYKISVNTERQQETQVTRTANNVRNLQTKVDRLNNEFSIAVEDISNNEQSISNLNIKSDSIESSITNINSNLDNNYTTNEKLENIITQTVQETTNLISQTGGFNLLENTQFYENLNKWEKSDNLEYEVLLGNNEVEQNTINGSELALKNGSISQYYKTIIGNEYTLSFKFKKSGLLEGRTTIRLYSSVTEYVQLFDSAQTQERRMNFSIKYTAAINNPRLVIETQDEFRINDLIIQQGISDVWSPNAFETRGLGHTLSGSNLALYDLNTSGQRAEIDVNDLTFKQNNQIKALYGAEELKVNNAVVNNRANIAGLDFIKVDNNNILIN